MASGCAGVVVGAGSLLLYTLRPLSLPHAPLLPQPIGRWGMHVDGRDCFGVTSIVTLLLLFRIAHSVPFRLNIMYVQAFSIFLGQRHCCEVSITYPGIVSRKS